MRSARLRWLGIGMLATAGAGLLGLTSMMNAAFAYGTDTSEIMGGSGLPIPPPSYLDSVNNLYIDPTTPFPGQPVFPGFTPQGLFTPEGLYPVTGIKNLTADASIAQGVAILNGAISQHIGYGNPDANDLVVFGFSQSSVISSLEMEQLDPNGVPSPDGPLSFVLTGDPMNPDGGLLERFAGLTFPALGQTFYGATPADEFPTTIYSLEYDGFADFPRYPINLLSDLNAVLGIDYVHGTYSSLTPAEVATAIQLPVTADPSLLTTYYMIPTENLPLLDPLRAVPVVGNPLADLLQPDLKVLVNLGYGDPGFGYSTGPANVPTPFELFPSLSDFEKVPGDLVTGTEQGITNFVHDITTGGLPSLPNLSSLLAWNPLTALNALATASPTDAITDIVNTLSSAAATGYATLLPTADIVNASLTSIPAYDVSLFVDGIQAFAGGNTLGLVDAVGDPIAADTGLLSVAAGFEFTVLAQAAQTIAADFTSLIP